MLDDIVTPEERLHPCDGPVAFTIDEVAVLCFVSFIVGVALCGFWY